MKNLIRSLVFLISFCGISQTTTVTYVPSSAVISNPERGFFKHSSSGSTSYNLLSQSSLTNYRLNSNITLIYRNFRLNNFVDSAISDAFLVNMQADFNAMRNAGLKCIIRFTYSSDDQAPVLDATKSRMISHIQQLKPVLQANGDVISVMEAGFIGAWGEWYYTDQAEFGGYGFNQTTLTSANYGHRKDILSALLTAIPANRMIQIRTPYFKRNIFQQNAITDNQGFSGSEIARIGHHNDCFLADNTDSGTYSNIAIDYPYLAQESKFLPVGGETCALNSPRSDCSTAILEMAKFHWSFLNNDYHPGVITAFQTENCFTDIQKNLGYRFVLNSAIFPEAISLNGGILPVTIKLRNEGYASPFNKRNAYIILKNLTTNQIYSLPLQADPRKWLGPNEITISENLTLPANLTAGNFKLYLSLPDEAPSLATRPEYAIRLANDNVWESISGYNSLNYTLNVTNLLGVAANNKLDLTIFPVPTQNELTIQMPNLNEYDVTVFNALGQQIKPSSSRLDNNSMTIDTHSLADGLYFVEFTKDSFQDTRKIVVKH